MMILQNFRCHIDRCATLVDTTIIWATMARLKPDRIMLIDFLPALGGLSQVQRCDELGSLSEGTKEPKRPRKLWYSILSQILKLTPWSAEFSHVCQIFDVTSQLYHNTIIEESRFHWTRPCWSLYSCWWLTL